MSNDKVIIAWREGRVASAPNLSTVEGRLYSYNLLIGETTDKGVLVYNYTSGGEYISQTTSCHVGKARRAGEHTLVTPGEK